MFDPQLIGPDRLWTGTLQNDGADAEIMLRMQLAGSDGTLVIEGESAPFRIASGFASLAFSGVRTLSTRHGGSEAARHFKTFGTLPSGRFEYCLEVIPIGLSEMGDRLCEQATSESLTIMDLVYPMDRDTILETRPLLNWMTTEPTLVGADMRFKLVLVREQEGQDPQAALATEKPVIFLLPVTTTTVPYPLDALELVRGGTYAWQVSKLVGDRVVDRTEAWRFVVAPDPVVRVMKYVRIDQEAGAGLYRPVDGRIYFRYDERYKGEALKCAVRQGVRYIEPTVLEDLKNGHGEANVKNQGLNEYELDLLPYHLKKGIYTLEVRSEKDKLHFLKFIIE